MIYISLLIQHHAGPTGKVLVCRSGDGLWHFPCGKARTCESDEDAAERTAWETLGMKIRVGKLALTGHKAPNDGTTEHIPCGNITHNTNTKCDWHNYYEAVDVWQTEPKACEELEYCWVPQTELGQLRYEGDDKAFILKYDPWINRRPVPDVRMP